MVARTVGLVVLGLLAGCSTVVQPPTRPMDPAPVFVLDHGRHTSLVVSTPEGRLVRYAYGDWSFYAEGRMSLGRAAAALFLNTPGALGRGEFDGPPTPERVRSAVPLVIESLYRIEVERGDIDALRERLDAIFEATEEKLYSPDAFLLFVEHPRNYTLRHNSNRVIGDWLRELGCEVRGQRLFANWRFDQPSTGALR
jgi:hypothetical protein